MRKFFVSVLTVTVLSMGVGALVEKAGARFKSDERAVALIKQARIAIGGEQSLADVRSMIIKGGSTHTFRAPGGTSKTEQGETEIAMQLPDKLSKMVKIGRHDGQEGAEKIMSEKHDVLIMKRDGAGAGEDVGAGEGGKKIIVKKFDNGNGEESVIVEDKEGEFKTADGKTIVLRKSDGPMIEKVIVGGPGEKGEVRVIDEKIKAEHAAMRQNELLRTTLSLLLTAPEGMDVNYTYGGETDVDGTTCNLVNAEFGGASIKLFLSKASSLPVAMSYLGHSMPNMMFVRHPAPTEGSEKEKVFTFTRKVDGPEVAEITVKFSDYRGVGGVQLPYKWTTSVGGQTTEVFDVSSYEINPANIAEKFQNQKTMMRWKQTSN